MLCLQYETVDSIFNNNFVSKQKTLTHQGLIILDFKCKDQCFQCFPNDGISVNHVRTKEPLVRNLKNEIMKFYDKVGFQASYQFL